MNTTKVPHFKTAPFTLRIRYDDNYGFRTIQRTCYAHYPTNIDRVLAHAALISLGFDVNKINKPNQL